jgi:hypothetical protein
MFYWQLMFPFITPEEAGRYPRHALFFMPQDNIFALVFYMLVFQIPFYLFHSVSVPNHALRLGGKYSTLEKPS